MAFGSAVILGAGRPDVASVWSQVVGPLMLTAALSSCASAGCAAVVAPQLASQQVWV